MRIFRSIGEIKECYFPDAYKKEQWDNMTPKEKGRYLALEIINKVKAGLKNEKNN